ncbi:hypothetical protein DOTSEDRAFT_67574 [Dothistroma septosporum NZE10]|uniref:Uncharacterized protein n=1 Tax=Dothistroma septosporum (strain NZE10 / CBS 128990) TaxID=675120 RepID=N1PYI2_DOTSN|nr:hypothetical protein DOTSEDRAFT_67574 [Dothistroma septosporum NZE10]
MMPPRDDASSTDDNSFAPGPGKHPPLVIVSERGRHSEASRRIVRAQAARASAAQSRETRARNREDRHRESPQSTNESASIPPLQIPPNANPNTHAQTVRHPKSPQSHSHTQEQGPSRDDGQQESSGNPLKPLMDWILNVLHLSAASFAAGAVMIAGTGIPQLGNASRVLSSAGGMLSDNGEAMESVDITGGIFNRRLPVALPRGFVALQGRIQISDPFLVLLSRTACIDFGSPGAETRLHELLFDIVMTSATTSMANTDRPGHPIQNHLRIACTCLTIFQGQRADGQAFAFDQRYNTGLEAAWAEVIVLDQDVLKEPKSAEAALWAIFVISVTCGSTMTFYHQLLGGLMQDLQLQYWEQVRNVLIDFIYPGSFLDAPCKQFYDSLKSVQAGQSGASVMA